jgi:hypothetical protein
MNHPHDVRITAANSADWCTEFQAEVDDLQNDLRDSDLSGQAKSDWGLLLRRAAHLIGRQRKELTRTLNFDRAEVGAIVRLADRVL